MGTQSCQRSGAFRETGRRQMLEHATDWYHAGNFCERMLVYKAGMSKIELLPKNSRLKALFRLDSVDRMLM